MISTEDMVVIRNYLKDFYVTKDECNDRHEQTNEKINAVALKQTEHGTKLNSIERLVWGVEWTIIVEVVGAVLALVILRK